MSQYSRYISSLHDSESLALLKNYGYVNFFFCCEKQGLRTALNICIYFINFQGQIQDFGKVCVCVGGGGGEG